MELALLTELPEESLVAEVGRPECGAEDSALAWAESDRMTVRNCLSVSCAVLRTTVVVRNYNCTLTGFV